jgi:hypothetical protein
VISAATMVLVGAGAFVVYWLLQPAPYPRVPSQHQADVPGFIQGMFAYLRPGAVVQIVHEGSARQLRLRKIHLSNGQHGIRLELPNEAGVVEYADHVRECLGAAGFHCALPEPLDPLWPAREPAILIVDQLDAITAFRAMEVARAAMGLDQDARYTIQLDGTPSLTATREYRKARSGPPAT